MKNLPYEQIAKYLAGESTDLEKQEVMSWIDKHPKEMAELTAIWQKANAKSVFFDIDNALDKVNTRIDDLENERKKPRNVKRLLLFAITIAASIALLFTIVDLERVFDRNVEIHTSKLMSLYSVEKETKEISLPDGSKITLNGSSSIKYLPEFTDSKREVYLEGEAFFDITPNPNRPFIIHANSTETRVLGTSFGIRAVGGEQEVVVTVATGVVEFVSEKTKSEVKLSKGEQAIYKQSINKIEKNEEFDANYLAWQTKILTFRDTPLVEVAKLLQEVYHVSISIDSSIENLKLTSTFEKLDIEELIQIIEITLAIEAQETESGIFLKNK